MAKSTAQTDVLETYRPIVRMRPQPKDRAKVQPNVLSLILALRLRTIEAAYPNFAEFADNTGIARQTLHVLRTGTANANLDTLDKLSRALNIPGYELFGLDKKVIETAFHRFGLKIDDNANWIVALVKARLSEFKDQCGTYDVFKAHFPGFGSATLNTLSNGRGNPEILTLERLALCLKMTIWRLLGIEEDNLRRSLGHFGLDFDAINAFIKENRELHRSIPELTFYFPDAWIKKRHTKKI